MTTDATPTPEHGPGSDAPGSASPQPSPGPGTSGAIGGQPWPYHVPISTDAYYQATWPGDAAATRRSGPGWRARIGVGFATALVIAALGFPLGWLWSSVAPWLPVTVSGGELFYAEPEGNQSAAQESLYVLISLGAGIVIAILAWVLLRRFRGPITILALALGGSVAGWIMWRFGRWIGRDHARELARAAKDGTTIKVPVDIRIQTHGLWGGFLPYIGGSLVYIAIASVILYAIITGFASYPDLIGRRRTTSPFGPAPFGITPGEQPAGQPSGQPWGESDPASERKVAGEEPDQS